MKSQERQVCLSSFCSPTPRVQSSWEIREGSEKPFLPAAITVNQMLSLRPDLPVLDRALCSGLTCRWSLVSTLASDLIPLSYFAQGPSITLAFALFQLLSCWVSFLASLAWIAWSRAWFRRKINNTERWWLWKNKVLWENQKDRFISA